MRRARHLVICAVFCGSLLATPSVAVAGQCNNSAANQQYVDPLACQTVPSHKGTQPTPAQATTPVASAPSTTQASTATSAAATTAGTSAPKSGKTLPFTGLDLWPAVLIGIGLLALGLVLRNRALAVRRWD